ncbi:MAG: hypothetical protein HY819_00865 [Acidobacteria bacterium]|nr:hypothetical protein [Acidobacteriota bacterium]
MLVKKTKSNRILKNSQEKLKEKVRARLPERLVALLGDLDFAIEHRRYSEVERIANDLLELSPSEEADQFIHDIISSAVTIIDAEDEIRYQFSDLQSALDNTSEEDLAAIEEKEQDGL